MRPFEEKPDTQAQAARSSAIGSFIMVNIKGYFFVTTSEEARHGSKVEVFMDFNIQIHV
jgi:hypothetical protein